MTTESVTQILGFCYHLIVELIIIHVVLYFFYVDKSTVLVAAFAGFCIFFANIAIFANIAKRVYKSF